MNERIKELSKQAYELQRHKHGGYFTQQLLLDAFAELILRECKLFCGHDSEGVSAMFKHFGVEE